MSNQSPGSASGKAHEPSMEDILASIRRMISDDDAPTAQAQDRAASDSATSEKAAPLEASSLVEAVEAPPVQDIPKSPIRNVGAPSVPTPMPVNTAPVPEPDFTFEAFEDDLDFEGDLVIPDAIEASSDEDLIDIDDLIAEVESRMDEDVKAATANIDTADFNRPTERAVSDNTDIELVKSLMADLTDDAAEEDHSDEPSDAELSQILDELSDIQVSDELAVEIDVDGDDELSALQKIAQDAKADANAFALGSGAADLATETKADIIDEPVDVPVKTAKTETQDPIIEQETKQETPTMSDAAEETIIGSDIEEATTSAFASLASVVERKDEVTTSGPAIGELVKDALKPMLKEWLDKNLKNIVERSVAKEIKRISDTK